MPILAAQPEQMQARSLHKVATLLKMIIGASNWASVSHRKQTRTEKNQRRKRKGVADFLRENNTFKAL